ncbi:MAG: retroviral-like aspartic protease family protein [Bacteroidetes bacterium]|nr:retroviral-like aspartic protease family protein [Bacteroidota bacterium]
MKIFLASAVVWYFLSFAAFSQQCGTYEMVDSSQKTEIPFEFYGMNIMVKTEINGVKVNMLIDNGVMWDELWFYGNNQVDSLGLTYLEDILIDGAGEGEGVQSKTATSVEMKFENITFKDQSAVVSPKEQGFAKLFPGIAGQLCGTFFKNFIVEFNFNEMLIKLHNPNDFEFVGNGFSLPMSPDTIGSYAIPVTIFNGDKEIEKEIFIDLGGIYPLSLVINSDFPLDDSMEKVLLGYGASGPIYGYKGFVDKVKIGNYYVEKPEAVFIENQADENNTNLTIGLPLLRQFNLTFDYFNNKLFIKPNSLTFKN